MKSLETFGKIVSTVETDTQENTTNSLASVLKLKASYRTCATKKFLDALSCS